MIRSGQDALLLAPTGSGKTLAAFLVAIDDLVRAHQDGPSTGPQRPGIRVLYVSPLRALGQDIRRSLMEPLEQLAARAAAEQMPWPPIDVAVRTADTPASQRQAMARRPPAILITTPESLFLMLYASPRLRPAFATVQRVIIDEIHALAPTKRGTHLCLTLELLDHLAGRPVQRVGLSATVREPHTRLGPFLTGGHRQPVQVVDAGHVRPLYLQVSTPLVEMPETPGEIWPAMARRLVELVQAHHSTLIFVGNRRLAERLTHAINELAGERLASTHHGSMARAARLDVEAALKAGLLRAVVATSTLELGIDVGAIDLVVHVESPPGVAQGVQRIGRSGHGLDRASRGYILAKHPSDLLQAAAVARAIQEFDIEPIPVPQAPLDVLAQHVVAATLLGEWPAGTLFELYRRAGPYHDTLTRPAFDAVLAMLAGDLGGPAGRPLRPRIIWERVQDRIRAAPSSRSLVLQNAGTIPDRGSYPVYLSGTATQLGELDEEFVYESRQGDVFWLGMAAWRIDRIAADRVWVSRAPSGWAQIPFWRGEVPGRSAHLGEHVGRLLRDLEPWLDAPAPAPPNAAVNWLASRCALDAGSAGLLWQYLKRQHDACGRLPTDTRIVVERFPDELGDTRVAIHSPWGRGVHRAWAMAIKGWAREHLGLDLDVLAADNGIMLRLPQEAQALPLEPLLTLSGDRTVADRVAREAAASPLVAALFREAAGRALLLARSPRNRRKPLWLQRLRAADLMLATRQEAGVGASLGADRNPGRGAFPIYQEALREALQDVLAPGVVERLVSGLRSGAVTLHPVERSWPSPFAASLLFEFTAAYLYQPDTPKTERLGMVHVGAAEELLQEAARTGHLQELIDPDVAAEVLTRRRFPPWRPQRPRSPDELEEWLRYAGDLSAADLATDLAAAPGLQAPTDAAAGGQSVPVAWMEILERQGRAVRLARASPPRGAARPPLWVHPVRLDLYRAIAEPSDVAPVGFESAPAQLEGAVAEILDLRADSLGVLTVAAVAARYGVPEAVVAGAVATLEAQGRLLALPPALAGALTPAYAATSLVQEMRRLTLQRARLHAEPVSPEAFARFLLRWHRIAAPPPGGVVSAGPDEETMQHVVQRLDGCTFPFSLLVQAILPARGIDSGPQGALARAVRAEGVFWQMQHAPGHGGGGSATVALLRPWGPAHRLVAVAMPDPVDDTLAPAERAIWQVVAEGGLWSLHEVAARITSGDMQHPAQAAPGRLAHPVVALLARGLLTADRWALALRLARPQRLASQPRRHRVPWRARQRGLLAAGVPQPPRPVAAWSSDPVLLTARIRALPAMRRHGRAEQEVDQLSAAQLWAEILLSRYGIVSREALSSAGCPLAWSHVANALQRQEARGGVLQGYFVSGLSGEQFALPEALDLLREVSREGVPSAQPVVAVGWDDPANPFGHLLPAPGWCPGGLLTEASVALAAGHPVALVRWASGSLWVDPSADTAARETAIAALVELEKRRQDRPARRVLRTCQGRALPAGAADVLDGAAWQRLGFHRGPRTLELLL